MKNIKIEMNGKDVTDKLPPLRLGLTVEEAKASLIESINDRDDYDADHYFILWKEALAAEREK